MCIDNKNVLIDRKYRECLKSLQLLAESTLG